MTTESKSERCYRCGGTAACYAYVDGRDAPLCLHCRIDDLKNEFEKRGGSQDLVAGFPRRRLGALTIHVGWENLNLTDADVRGLDAENLEILDWAVKLLRSDTRMKSVGDHFAGLAGAAARSELTTESKNAAIDNFGVLALDRVGVLLMKDCPSRA